MGWLELLSNRFVVVLDEASTGKTTEFKQQTLNFAAQGKFTFLIPLEDLAEERQLFACGGADKGG